MKIVLAKNVNKHIDESIYELFCLYAKKCSLDVFVAKDLTELEVHIATKGADCVAVFGGESGSLPGASG